jgi:HAD superfamily hydrolase (TIGR01549 family)
MPREQTSFLFDLDGTLVDSVYQHVLAWREALEAEGISLSVWRIHRKIGMSGGLFTHMLLRETGLEISADRVERLKRLHAEAYKRQSGAVQALPGARELLAYLTGAGIPWAIATSGHMESARPVIERLGVDFKKVPVVTRDQVKYAKPDPDLFLTAADRLGVDIGTATVVGDSVWDMLASRRARALGIGLLSGGYGDNELQRAGAYRVYDDPADMLNHIDEVAGRR